MWKAKPLQRRRAARLVIPSQLSRALPCGASSSWRTLSASQLLHRNPSLFGHPSPTLCPEAPYLLSIATMVSTRGALRVSARKQTARPARIEVAPKHTGGRIELNSPTVVIRGATRPPRRALTEAKPIPICLSEECGQVSGRGLDTPKGLGVPGGRAERKDGSCWACQECQPECQGLPDWGRLSSASPRHPPDLRGVQLSREQVHADEGAGQAAFAQRCLGCPQGLHIWWW